MASHRVDRERVVAIPCLRVRRDLGLREVPHHLAEGILLRGQVEVHRTGSYACPVPASPYSSRSRLRRDRGDALAVVGDRLATDLVDVTSDLTALDRAGFWAVVVPFSGEPTCARFADVRAARPWPGRPWVGPDPGSWRTSLDRPAFEAGVGAIRAAIGEGDVYQVNLTRRLSAPLPRDAEIPALGAALASGNPAPYSAVVHLPDHGIAVASASPERFLTRRGARVWSSPIKGTAAAPDGFLAKDRAENVMIVDLVRNDLGRVCEFGTVRVPSLLTVESASRALSPGDHRRR